MSIFVQQTGLKTLVFLIKSLCLTKDIGVTDFVTIIAINLATLCCTTQVRGLHNGKNRAKLVGFKEPKHIFCVC